MNTHTSTVFGWLWRLKSLSSFFSENENQKLTAKNGNSNGHNNNNANLWGSCRSNSNEIQLNKTCWQMPMCTTTNGLVQNRCQETLNERRTNRCVSRFKKFKMHKRLTNNNVHINSKTLELSLFEMGKKRKFRFAVHVFFPCEWRMTFNWCSFMQMCRLLFKF